MKTRIITSLVAIAIGISVLILNNTFIYPLMVCLIAALSVHEILTVCDCQKHRLHYVLCIAFAVCIPLLTWFTQVGLIWKLFAASLIVFLMFAGYVANHKKLSFDKLAVMVSVTTLITLSVTCLVSIKNISEIHGICYVVMALMAAWIPDGGAYFVGTFLGKKKLCPEISPKKTVEGAAGGIVVTVIVFMIYGLCYKNIMLDNGVAIGINYAALAVIMVLAALISMVGDLSASLLKREHGIKDFGKILPGHGGIVDRFDSVYFVLPYMMLIFNAFGDKIFYTL